MIILLNKIILFFKFIFKKKNLFVHLDISKKVIVVIGFILLTNELELKYSNDVHKIDFYFDKKRNL
jgi:hypothetical protein